MCLLKHHLKCLHANKTEAGLLVAHCHQLQKGEGLSQSLQELEGAFRDVDHKSGAKEPNLQVDQIWIFLTYQYTNVCMCECPHRPLQLSLICPC